MNAVLLDDEELVLKNLKMLLRNFPEIKIVYEGTDPSQCLEFMRNNTNVDIAFLDIAMPDISGIEVAEYISEMNWNIKIVFITAYEQYALDAFRVNTVDYLLKPITLPRLTKTIQRINNKQKEIENQTRHNALVPRIQGMRNEHWYMINIEDGIFIKTEPRKIILVTAGGEYELMNTINYWESFLAEHGWFRCHRSYLINLNMIESTYPLFNQTYGIKMKYSKEEVIVSRNALPEYKRLLHIK